MKLDTLDTRILQILLTNARTPITVIAKKVRRSREVVTYRINNMQKEGIIIQTYAEIDESQMGFIGAAVFITIKSTKEEAFKKAILTTGFVSWVAKLSGIWNYGFSIYGKDNHDIDQKFNSIYTQFKDSIINYRFTLHKKTTFYYEKYFNVQEKSKERYNETNDNKKEMRISDNRIINNKDKQILKSISSDARMDCVKLSKITGITAVAVAQRIKKLEKIIIKKYSTFINLSKIGKYQYSVFMNNKDTDNKKFMSYLKNHQKISFIAQYIGDQFIEIGVIVDNPYELRTIIEEIQESFQENTVIEISLFQEEYLSIGPPACIFE